MARLLSRFCSNEASQEIKSDTTTESCRSAKKTQKTWQLVFLRRGRVQNNKNDACLMLIFMFEFDK
jgi:hypothetical protein